MSDVPHDPNVYQESDDPGAIPQDAKNLAVISHVLGFLTSFIGPLLIWVLKKDEHPFVEDQSKEALNFQITIVIGHIVAAATWCVIVGIVLTGVLLVVQCVFSIIAAVKASGGEKYRYPMTLRLVK